MKSTSPNANSPQSLRFTEKRELIIDVASQLINRNGLKGLTLVGVAEALGLSGSSVTYYFNKKELLAAACYQRALEELEKQAIGAAKAGSPREIIEYFLQQISAASAGGEQTGRRELVRLLELRAMEDPYREALIRRYFSIFAAVRSFFKEFRGDDARLLQIMRAHILLEMAHMLPIWLQDYVPQDHPRVVRRLVELLDSGWAPTCDFELPPPSSPGSDDPGQGADRFLGAATQLINERGYRGASVDRIAAALKLTKGSFYHHLEAKDDLVLACFRHSLATIETAQDQAVQGRGTYRTKLIGLLHQLTSIQLGNKTPLLRATAFPVMPSDLRREAMVSHDRIVRRFSGIITDGISEGSISPIDPQICGQFLMGGLNAAVELRQISSRLNAERAVSLYTSLITSGLCNRRTHV